MKKRGLTLIEALVAIAVVCTVLVIVLAVVEQARAGGMPTDTAITESNVINDRLRDSVPVPQLTTSSERKNVARRAELFNNEDKISYIYLVNYGRVMAFFTVQGKVSSLQSYMTPTEKLSADNGEDCNRMNSSTGNAGCYVVSAPDIDGTYGENVEGIFFFTTEGAYVEWRGEYMMSDQPLTLTTQPELVREID